MLRRVASALVAVVMHGCRGCGVRAGVAATGDERAAAAGGGVAADVRGPAAADGQDPRLRLPAGPRRARQPHHRHVPKELGTCTELTKS